MCPLYERPVSELMQEAAAEVAYPARPNDFVGWFAERYERVSPKTVRHHVIGLTANDRNRRHYPWLAVREPLFTRADDGSLMPFDASVEVIEAEDDEFAAVSAGTLEFALEAYLEGFLLTNW